MRHQETEAGFTIAEMIVTLVVLSLFLGFLFQAYMLSFSQKNTTVLRTTANDVAQSNVRKITKRADIPAAGICDDTIGTGNTNNLQRNQNATGTVIASGGSWPSPMKPESLTDTGLPASTTQSLTVIYPQGCNSLMPAKIISTVTYGSETVVHATYVAGS